MTIDQGPSREAVFCPFLRLRPSGSRVLVSVETDFTCPRFRAPDYVMCNALGLSEVPGVSEESLEEISVQDLCDDGDEWSETDVPNLPSRELTDYQLGPAERGPECKPGEGCREHG